MIAPGWYHDGVTPNAERWFDGVAWTEHLRPAPAAPPAYPSAVPQGAPPGAQPWAAQQPTAQPWTAQPWTAQPWTAQPWATQPGAPTGPDDAMYWMLPVGRSWQSITAGYLGLFGLVIWPLAPIALGLGIWAMRIPGGHGRGRAIFAIIAGALGTIFGTLALIFWV